MTTKSLRAVKTGTALGIYLASKWANKITARNQMDALEARGHTIVHDWTTHKETKTTEKEYADEAEVDVAAIRNADLFIAHMDDDKYAYRGTFFEMGVAVGADIPVVIVTPFVTFNPAEVGFHSNTFTAHPAITRVKTLEEALALVPPKSDLIERLVDFGAGAGVVIILILIALFLYQGV